MLSQGVTFACINAAAPQKEGSAEPQPLSTFAFRCKDPAARDCLVAAIEEHKGQVIGFPGLVPDAPCLCATPCRLELRHCKDKLGLVPAQELANGEA